MKTLNLITGLIILFCACSGDENEPDEKLYFPPSNSETWETISPGTLGWNSANIAALLTLLEENGTRGFIVIKDGKIVIEEYFGKALVGGGNFNKSSIWYWASAGKTLTATLTGIAQKEGLLSIRNKTSGYLGTGWTSMAIEKENRITVWNQLTMTTGLDDEVPDNHDFTRESLIYKANAGSRWAYHNGPYTLLGHVIETATGESFEGYFNQKIKEKTGMDGFWQWIGNDHVYFSTPRSMARFGLLILNKGVWGRETIIKDKEFFTEMISTSQPLNKSYGYLWWLNGKESFRVPESQLVFNGSVSPNAPVDMISGMGKNGQYVSVIPSMRLVVVRMGESPDNVPVPFLFLDEIWKKLNLVIR